MNKKVIVTIMILITVLIGVYDDGDGNRVKRMMIVMHIIKKK